MHDIITCMHAGMLSRWWRWRGAKPSWAPCLQPRLMMLPGTPELVRVPGALSPIRHVLAASDIANCTVLKCMPHI